MRQSVNTATPYSQLKKITGSNTPQTFRVFKCYLKYSRKQTATFSNHSPEGHGFESRLEVSSSSSVGRATVFATKCFLVQIGTPKLSKRRVFSPPQLSSAEHQTFNLRVAGSSPAGGTNKELYSNNNLTNILSFICGFYEIAVGRPFLREEATFPTLNKNSSCTHNKVFLQQII